METLVTLVVAGSELDARRVEKALEPVPGTLTEMGVSRNLGSALKGTLRWAFKFVGDAAQVGDGLIEQATRQLAGATMEVEYKGMKVKVTNANRSQLLALLRQAQHGASQASDL